MVPIVRKGDLPAGSENRYLVPGMRSGTAGLRSIERNSQPMMRAIFIVLLALYGHSAAMAAPSQLYGKTVSVSWTEDLMRRGVGEQTFTHRQHPRVAIIYISSSGRPFIRIRSFTRGGGGALDEQVGASGKTTIGGGQTADFKDRSLTVTSVYQGGAQRLQVDFDGNYQSCTASVIVGKQAGAQTYTRLNGSHEPVEIQSNSPSSATCTIESGNAFAK
jgi:hypothetical protein